VQECTCDHGAVQQANPKQVSINDVVAIKNHDCKFSIGVFLMIII
jgi:hypothetical protein